MRNGSVFFKPSLGLLILALITLSFFSSCQKTATTQANVGDWAIETEYAGIPRTQAVSFTMHYPTGDTVYIGGGYNTFTNTYLTDFYKFDESNNHSWLPVANFPGDPRDGSAGFAIGTNGYIIGGYDGNYHLNDVWKYNATTNSWDSIGMSPVPYGTYGRVGAIGFTIGNTGYYGSGADSSQNCYNDMYQFDGTTWSPAPSLTAKRKGASVFVYNNIAYVVGGVNSGSGNSYPADLSAYNPAVSSDWQPRRSIITISDSSFSADYAYNINRSAAAVFLINDTAYLSTGNYNGVLNTTWCYDIGQDIWFQKSSFEGTSRENAIGFNVNNHGYIATGDNGSNCYDDVWQFYPDAALTADDNIQ
jgi:N-acetylneuraminic acid mutarotase